MAKLIYSVQEVHLSLLKSEPPKLHIAAKGTVTTTGWTHPRLRPRFNIHHPPADGIFEFDFAATPPTGIVLPTLMPIQAAFIMDPAPDKIVKVIVHSRTNSAEGKLPAPEPKPLVPPVRKATGYSNNFSFDEAFRDAIDNLPPMDPPYPDYLEMIKVVETGAMIGGIAGLHRMYVKIEAH
jgi:hypothetical protein